MRLSIWAACAGALMSVPAAQAAVTSASDNGFAVENSIDIEAGAQSVYALLAMPDRWWSGAHSYSGDAANLRLEPRAGGCFCEAIPGLEGAAGSVEHARIIYAAPDRQLRMYGALGPLQAEAVMGTLNFDIVPGKNGVRVTMTYVAGGYMRMGAARIAPIVDKVLAEQLAGLKRAAEAGRR